MKHDAKRFQVEHGVNTRSVRGVLGALAMHIERRHDEAIRVSPSPRMRALAGTVRLRQSRGCDIDEAPPT
jgi:hypothetical protein